MPAQPYLHCVPAMQCILVALRIFPLRYLDINSISYTVDHRVCHTHPRTHDSAVEIPRADNFPPGLYLRGIKAWGIWRPEFPAITEQARLALHVAATAATLAQVGKVVRRRGDHRVAFCCPTGKSITRGNPQRPKLRKWGNQSKAVGKPESCS